jgi:hypothetical protein
MGDDAYDDDDDVVHDVEHVDDDDDDDDDDGGDDVGVFVHPTAQDGKAMMISEPTSNLAELLVPM